MQADAFNWNDYCQRIHYQGEAPVNYATLKALMQQQLYHIPFENLDVLAGKVISLQADDIVDKLVTQQRGGYCYEVNGLFAMALEHLGFSYRWAAARPMFYPMRRPRTHAVLLVTLDGVDWLCDLGFGNYGIREPISLQVLDQPILQAFDQYSLSREGEEWIVKAFVDGEWVSQYGFALTPFEWIDFVPANWLNSTHPEVIFKQKPLIVRYTPTGRYSLFGDVFKHSDRGVVAVRHIQAEEQSGILEQYFGLNLK